MRPYPSSDLHFVPLSQSIVIGHNVDDADNGFSFDNFTVVPEPVSIALVGIGTLAFFAGRRRREG